jgi:hypothetical protein
MKKKIGEAFTVIREVSAGTGYSFYLTQISGGLALVNFTETSQQGCMCGGKVTQTFTFICLQPGEASYQLAKFRVFDTSDALYEQVMPVYIEGETSSNNMPGGWTDYHKPGNEELKVFSEAFEGFVGVQYTPILVKSQIVNGTNYSYITNAKGVYPGAQPYKAQVSIYKPINGKAVITNITKIEQEALNSTI